jgi:hypothetical protein
MAGIMREAASTKNEWCNGVLQYEVPECCDAAFFLDTRDLISN